VPSWYTDEWDRDSSADRYQAAHERREREDMRLGVQPPTTAYRPVEVSCGRCSYVIVDGACVGCGPWQPSLSERDQRRGDVSQEGSSPRARTDVAEVNEGELTTSDPNRSPRSERDAA
jgi:hypothetical protein